MSSSLQTTDKGLNILVRKEEYQEIESFIAQYGEESVGLTLEQIEEIDIETIRRYKNLKANAKKTAISDKNWKSMIGFNRFIEYLVLTVVSVCAIGIIFYSNDFDSKKTFRNSTIFLILSVTCIESINKIQKNKYDRIRKQVLYNYIHNNNML